jgi:ubiquinone/menaquinone biosynthesis C-methylase UbiE
MNSIKPEHDYWINYWNNNHIIDIDNSQIQIGRTINKTPIDEQRWQFTLHEIERMINLDSNDIFLDLCAGNGLITIPFSLKVCSVTAVDISNALLQRIDTHLYSNVTLIEADIRSVNLPVENFSKGVMYFALQHFSEHEVIGIFETIYQSLKPSGIFLIGDIPDIDRIFTFYSKPEWITAYFDSLKNNTPAIGTWFKKEILIEMAKYIGFSKVEIITQHPELINSHYRFDLLLSK